MRRHSVPRQLQTTSLFTEAVIHDIITLRMHWSHEKINRVILKTRKHLLKSTIHKYRQLPAKPDFDN